MREYVIVTDTTSDLPQSYIDENQLPIIPIYYTLDNKVYGDGGDSDLDPKEFYAKMRSGLMPTTMAANPQAVEKVFRKYLDQGLDILYVAFSSGLSGSYNVAAVTARDLSEEYSDAKIIVIDSLCASLGEGLLVHKAVQLKKQGNSLEENAKWLEKYKLNLCHQFTVDDLHHLHRGGRVSKATAIVGTLISVKPVLHVDNEGKLVSLHNVRGRKKALTALVNNMENCMEDYKDKNDIVFISHGDCEEDAWFVANLIKERFGIESFLVNMIGPTIGTHSGPGTVALFFMGETR